MMNLKLLVCCHKEDTKVENDFYLPIHVGKSNSKNELHITGDDTGENISHKNASYCELTGMYWAWKNLKNVEFIGLCHYRRYFDFTDSIFSIPSKSIGTSEFKTKDFIIPKEVQDFLRDGSVILPKQNSSKLSLYADYCLWHNSEDIKTLEDIIKTSCDARYHQAYDKIMYGNTFSPYNMFIMSWKDYDNYCTWLFSLLERVEGTIDITAYKPYQKRIFGFMAERLLNIYVEANKLQIREYPVLFVTNETTGENSFLRYKLTNIYNKFVSKMLNLRRVDL